MLRYLLLASLLLPAACTAQRAVMNTTFVGSIERKDATLDALIDPGARIEVLADGFVWTEGPVWVPEGAFLLFSDIPKNTVYAWKEGEGLRVFLRPAGHAEPNPPGVELGTNGLALDENGSLVVADHGGRRIARINQDLWIRETLVDRFEGRRLNSPNDLVVTKTGDIYFTDPPYGLAGLNDSNLKELPHNGVYLLRKNGDLVLLSTEFTFPNGVALSPDERTLYVAQSDPARAIIMAFPRATDGTLGAGRPLFDATPLVEQGKKGLPDGLTVDRKGNLWASGPGGVLVLTPDGRHLGTIVTGQATSNVAFGDDGTSLYMTADNFLMRLKTRTTGF